MLTATRPGDTGDVLRRLAAMRKADGKLMRDGFKTKQDAAHYIANELAARSLMAYDTTRDRYQWRPSATSPARRAAALTPHDSNDLATYAKQLYVGTTGNLTIVPAGDTSTSGTGILFSSVPVGWFPVQVRRVNATGHHGDQYRCGIRLMAGLAQGDVGAAGARWRLILEHGLTPGPHTQTPRPRSSPGDRAACSPSLKAVEGVHHKSPHAAIEAEIIA
jgi:hypothetical protein